MLQSWVVQSKHYLTKRSLVTLLLGFSSGLPLVLIASTLQAWYTTVGVGIMTVGALSLIGQPYTWKFLWAPIFDRFSPLGLGRRRGWIAICQFVIAICLIWVSFQNPKQHPLLLAGVALFIAFISASQDTSIDAYRTDLMPDNERGVGAAMTTMGYRMAMLVAGALGLVMASTIGWHMTYIVMALFMFGCLFVTLVAPQPDFENKRPTTLKTAVVEPFKDFIKRPFAIAIIFFIITYKLTDALALSLNTYFLLHFLKFSLIELGSVTKICGIVGTILGVIVGGAVYARIGLYRSLLYFGVLQAAAALSFAALTIVGKNLIFMAISIFCENFCSGLSSVALIVYLTALCNKRYTATQYAMFSAIMALGRVYIGPVAAALVKHIGWFDFYILSFLIGFVPLIILWWLHRENQLVANFAGVQ